MSDCTISEDRDELGVFAWVKVPRSTLASTTLEHGFTFDFRLSVVNKLRYKPDDVSPAKPVGKIIRVGSAIDAAATSRHHVAATHDEVEDARTRDCDGPWTLSMVPLAESSGGTQFEIETGPLSFAQPWLDGVDGYEGCNEQPGCGLRWRHSDAADILLISLVSDRACPPSNEALPPADARRWPEHGVFAWIGMPKHETDKAVHEKTSEEPAQPLFAAEFRTRFTPWQPGALRGIVCPPEVVEMDIYRPLTRLISIELAHGRWTLWAKRGATDPTDFVYTVVCGPRSEATHWIHTDEGKDWRARFSKVALVTLTSHAIPF